MENLKLFGSVSLMMIGIFLMITSRKPHAHCCGEESPKVNGSRKIPVLLGVSIGLYPCPTLVATFLASLSTGQLNLGVTAVGLFAMGSFISILSSALILKWLGTKFMKNFTLKAARFNWKRLQGVIVFAVGVFSLIRLDHH